MDVPDVFCDTVRRKSTEPFPCDNAIRVVSLGIRRIRQPNRDTVAVRDGGHACDTLPQLLEIAVFRSRSGLLSAVRHLGRDSRFGNAAHGIHHRSDPVCRLRNADYRDDPARS